MDYTLAKRARASQLAHGTLVCKSPESCKNLASNKHKYIVMY